MRSLRAAPLTAQARWSMWWADHDPAALVSRWRGHWHLFWADVASMGEGGWPMDLTVGSTCPLCRCADLVVHCQSRGCAWLKCPRCFKRMRAETQAAKPEAES